MHYSIEQTSAGLINSVRSFVKKRRRSHFFFLGVLLGLPVVILLINKKSGFLNQRALLLHLSNGHWHVSEPAETSQIKNLYLTADGSLWLLHHNNRISLFSKETWTTYSSRDFGNRSPSYAAYPAAGDALWAAAGDKLFRFAKDSWAEEQSLYPVPFNYSLAISAAAGRVWVLDRRALYEHDGQTWKEISIQSIRDVQEPKDRRWERIHAANDGSLWLLSNELWRYQNDSWEKIDTSGFPLVRSAMFGSAAERLYLIALTSKRTGITWSSQTELGYIDLRTGTFAQIDLGQIAQESQVLPAVSSAGEIFVLTGQKLYRRNTESLSLSAELPQLPPGVALARQLAIDPQGGLWLTADQASPLSRKTGLSDDAIALTTVVLIICLPLTILFFLRRTKKKQRLLAAALVAQFPHIYHIDAATAGQDGALGANEGVSSKSLKPLLSILASHLLPLILILFAGREGLALASPVILLAVFVYAFFIYRKVKRTIKDFHSGKYGEVLGADEAIRNSLTTEDVGRLLLYSGEFESCVDEMRRKISEQLYHAQGANIFINLGKPRQIELGDLFRCLALALAGQEDYSDARTVLEHSLAISLAGDLSTNTYEALAALAEICIAEDKNLEEGLILANGALDIHRILKPMLRMAPNQGPLSAQMFAHYPRLLSTRALALNALRRTEDAEKAIAEALKKKHKNLNPESALILLRAGIIALSSLKADEARCYFEQAASLDPDGESGRKARSMLTDDWRTVRFPLDARQLPKDPGASARPIWQ